MDHGLHPGRLVMALLVVAAAAPPLLFAGRTLAASWLVFPDPLPSGPRAGVTLDRVRQARTLAPGEPAYAFYEAWLLRDRFRRNWLGEDAAGWGTDAATAAAATLELAPLDAYARRLAGAIALDRSMHPVTSKTEVASLVNHGVDHMERALRLSPSSPLLQQQVGLELLRAWPLLDGAGRELATGALRRAATLDPGTLSRTLQAVWGSGAVRGEGDLELLGSIAPSAAPSRLELARFLEARSGPIRALDTSFGQAITGRAMVEYSEAADLAGLDASYLEAWVAASSDLATDDPEGFIATARRLAARHPRHPARWLVLAEARRAAGDTAGALDALERGLTGHNTTHAGLHRLLLRRRAALHLEAGENEAAVELYERLAALDPDDPDPLLQAGRGLERLGRREEALDRYRRAVQRAPASTEARVALARVHADRHEYLEAIEQWRAVASADPEAVDPLVEIARLYVRLGLLEEAVRHYSDALELAPDHPVIRRELDELLRRRDGS